MKILFTLLRPRLLALRPSPIPSHGKGGLLYKLLFLSIAGIGLWVSIFFVSLRVLRYFNSIEELGELLAFKLLAMMLITFLSLLIFSSILTCLSKLYLSKDLDLVHAMPVPARTLFFARWIESTMDSSWMVVAYSLPIFIAYGIVFNSGAAYYGIMLVTLLSLCVISAGLSALVVMTAVMLIPANRIRSLFILLGLLLFIVLFLAFRLLRPERLVDPEAFATVLTYLNTLQTPASPLIPSTWAFNALKQCLTGFAPDRWRPLGLLITFSGFIVSADIVAAHYLYARGFSKSQTAKVRLFKFSGRSSIGLALLPGPVRAFAVKEIKSFLRDQTQWSQIFLISALVIIYIYNFKVLPIDRSPIGTVYLQNLLSFLNMGLAAFVLTAVTGRFAYPAISNENNAFWIVKSAPVKLKHFLWVKFFIYLIPLLILTEILVVTTNLLLQVTPFMMGLSVITIFFLVPGVVALGIGLGAAYPNFKSENPAQSLTSFGGLVFMILSAAYIASVLLLEAGPVYEIFMAGLKGRSLHGWQRYRIIGSFASAFIINVAAVFFPMYYGHRQLSRY